MSGTSWLLAPIQDSGHGARGTSEPGVERFEDAGELVVGSESVGSESVSNQSAVSQLSISASDFESSLGDHFTLYDIDSERFQDDATKRIRYYDICRPIGFAVLIGNDRTQQSNYQDLLPVQRDLRSMKDVFNHNNGWGCSTLNCNTSKTFITREEWFDYFMWLKRSEFQEYSCFLFYYTGHGNSIGVSLSDGSCISYEYILTTVNKIDSLKHKPKIFIFDNCRIQKALCFKDEIPPDSIVCYSTTDGEKSFSCDYWGSFYTAHLTRLLRQFMNELSFTEIVTLTHGWVTEFVQQKYQIEQQPVTHSSLNKLLLLYEKGDSDVMVFPIEETESETDSPQKFVYAKGSAKSTNKGEIRNEKLQFKTREDVINNLLRLGQGVSVFVCYAPDPESPYNDPRNQQAEISRNRKNITFLIHDLERFGFSVISDIHLGDTKPRNWLQWYVSRMELCDYLIMVCSPAFKELFSCEKPQNPILDQQASWFLTYRNVMHANIVKEVNESPTKSKFVPIILEKDYSVDNSVPTLFQMATHYYLGCDGNRSFDYDKMDGEYEKLVCRMAGIDRMKLERPHDRGVTRVAPPFSQTQDSICPSPAKRRKGYKLKKWAPSGSNSPIGGQPSPAQHSFPSSSTHALLPPSQIPSTNSTLAQPSPPQHTPSSTQALLDLHQTTREVEPQSQHSSISTSQVTPSPPPPSSLPDKPPSLTIILWLCERLTDWKMIARFLKFDGSEIERISIDNDAVKEQRFQMFDSWQRHKTREYSYRTLGDVLWNSESNRHLYGDYCLKVMSSIENA